MPWVSSTKDGGDRILSFPTTLLSSGGRGCVQGFAAISVNYGTVGKMGIFHATKCGFLHRLVRYDFVGGPFDIGMTPHSFFEKSAT